MLKLIASFKRAYSLLIIASCIPVVISQTKDSSVSILQDLFEDPKFSVDFMDFFIAESSLPQFLHSDKALPGSEFEFNNQTLNRRLVLKTEKGEQFLCDVSSPPDPKEEEAPLLSPEEQARATQEGVERGVSKLNSLEGSCLAMRAGWWTYKFCYNGEVSQFHLPTPDEEVKEGTPLTEFVLGSFSTSLPIPSVLSSGEDEADSSTEIKSKESSSSNQQIAAVKATVDRNVLIQRWGGGTPCDLNKQYRSVEIHYQCYPGEQGRILAIKEPMSCHYQLDIGSPQLCDDPFYAEKNIATVHPIKCAEVVPDNDLERRQEEALQRAKTKKELEASKKAQAKKRKDSNSPFANILALTSPGATGSTELQNILQSIINQNQPTKPQENSESVPESETNTDSKESVLENQDVFLDALSKLLKLSNFETEIVEEKKTTEPEEDEDNFDEL